MPVVACVLDSTSAGGTILRIPFLTGKVFVVEGGPPLEVAVAGDVHNLPSVPSQLPYVGYPPIMVNNKPVVLDSTPTPDGGATTMLARKIIAT